MEEFLLLESSTLRQKFCTNENTLVLDRAGQLISLPKTGWTTTDNVAKFYSVSLATIKSVVSRHKDEFIADGYKVLSNKEFRELHNATLNSKSRSIAIFTRRAVLRVGMLLRNSDVAKMIRFYLLNTENQHEKQIGVLSEMAQQLTKQATQLSQNVEQLNHQAQMITAIVNELHKNRDNIHQLEIKVNYCSKRLESLEELVFKGVVNNTVKTISQNQINILKAKVKTKGRPISIWKKFNKHFEISRYVLLPQQHYEEALRWLDNLSWG